MVQNKIQSSRIQRNIFNTIYLTAIIQEMAFVGAGFIDGIIISKALGSTAMAAEGLISPYFSAIGILSGAIVTGNTKLCVEHLCKGEKAKAENILSSSILFTIIVSVLVGLACILFADTIASLVGASPNNHILHENAKDYLIGLAIGAPAIAILPVLIPIAQLSGKKLSIKVSLIVIAVLDIGLDILSASCGFGMFGMGLATSIARYVGLIILLIPMLLSGSISLKINALNLKLLINVFTESLPKIVRRTCNLLRPITLNLLLMNLVGSAGMSAMAIKNNLSWTMDGFSLGLGTAVMTMAILYTSECNQSALKNTKKRSIAYVLTIILGISLLLFIFAKAIAEFYITDNPLAVEYTTTALRFVAIDLLFISINEILLGYWQGIGKGKELGIIIFLQMLVLPIVCAFICSKLFGVTGVWISFPLSTLLSIICFAITNFVQTKKLELFPIPNACNAPDSEHKEYTINQFDQVSKVSEDVQRLCINNGIDCRRAMYTALYVEEIVRLVLEKGIAKRLQKKTVDIFITIADDKIILRMQDNCKDFDIVDFFGNYLYNQKEPENDIGIKMLMKMSDDILHTNTYKVNNLTVKL